MADPGSTDGDPVPRREGPLARARSRLRAAWRASRTEAELARAREEVARQAAENARLREQAQDALRARDEFLAVAAHELRTPLTPLMVELGLLERRLDAGEGVDATWVRPRVEAALRHARRVGHLVDRLLDVTRLGADASLVLVPSSVDLSELVRRVVDGFRPRLERTGTQLTLELTGPVCGQWDEVRLRLAVASLVENALTYGAGRPLHVRVTRDEALATVEVVDHGIGIPEQQRSRIFERYTRGVPVRSYGGLGVGLWLADRVIAAHHGVLRTAETPGGGATFTIELPLDPAADRGA